MAKYSLLSKKEEKRNLRRAALFTFLTLLLIFGSIFWGIPALIKMAVFFGNIRGSSQPIEIKDNLPPQVPILNALPEATNQSEIEIFGITETGASVKIFLTGQEVKETVADNEGNFSSGKLNLTLGQNEIYALAIDKAGNQSTVSNKISVWYDNEPPTLEISQPEDNKTISDEKAKVNIIGKTEEDVELRINDHLVILEKEGNFEYTLGLNSGENKIHITATDKAGNQTEKSLTVTYSP
ncbi:hypothetical protein COY29_04860 [Candidatus Woesebacteria bacterium CG_4_10_14_0_2_um_filter_39_14]|uniref:Bacterial Ig-like domain-containing protein n=3 Tax=Microgenomates group TaxID=1794810 RepID=A0A2M6YPX4_9BACT|nr:MAG: hypothetical protein COT04_01425 [Candidatus Shapirobacteria bacterium CG07_land_8_20_14_0_80_39_12]PIZ47681.1 MAG: hypothetical protein COY29_04860 [Candidatus Woesebacteria bacterium CG_4_10_14_0_2_um_filter_39_14]PJA49983.1 MAG: hypothetical protein CO169_00395 [Candidatus Shapirobacteria bacterium CG_4_9_14_3_um_filter_39_13]